MNETLTLMLLVNGILTFATFITSVIILAKVDK